ncbi:PREDICTED: prostacyclin synthase [Cyprinodon variegatus]|uniref:Prostacyclin synthase n=1 Tax=Cyprinodon variegatus TaxID=28743 RepID=A0A3Q2FJH2_CYPVA|nr:PREDICTED: prostacyclin synthase [Cyprinodon variegatus]
MLGTAFLLLNGLLILLLLFTFRTRKKNEPPLDLGFIPWLGHALEMRNDVTKFLARMKDKHGDIFTVRVAGLYVTVLLDPHSFDDVLNDNTNSFDSTHIRGQLLKQIFNLQLPGNYPTSERKWMEPHFQGLNLDRLKTSMNIHLTNVMLKSFESCSPSEWREEGLFELCYSFLFRAGYLTLFEMKDDVAAIYEEFRKFDNLLPKLARSSLKQEEKKMVATSQERLLELLSPKCLNGESEANSWQQSYVQFLQQQGIDVDMQKKAHLLQLWTTQCNAGPAAFWLLSFLLTHPEAMEAVKSEIRDLLSLQDTSLQRHHLNWVEGASTPVFDSILNETLRLTTSVSIRREVVQDKILRMANGKEYRLRRGDRVLLFPFLSPQMDPEIYEEPEMFKHDRFLNKDKTVKKEFFKDGKQLKDYILPWGAGKSICVGRKFAVTTIKQFVFLLLTHFDLELCNPDTKVPPFNQSRFGFGMLQPDGDLQVRFRLKRTQPEI